MTTRRRATDWVWIAAVHARDLIKRLGLSGAVEPLLTYLGPRLFRVPRDTTVVTLPTGPRLAVPGRFPSYRNYVNGVYERDVAALLPQLLRAGDCVLDVGANVGYYTFQFARLVGPDGRVLAFEPDPVALTHLQLGVDLNSAANVEIVPAALADRPGSAVFTPDSVERGHLGGGGASGVIEVATLTIDRALADRGWPAVALIKMDIEGGEVAALHGMVETARRNPQLRLLVEYNPHHVRRAGATSTQLRDALVELGFESALVIERRQRIELSAGLPPGSAMLNLLVARELPSA